MRETSGTAVLRGHSGELPVVVAVGISMALVESSPDSTDGISVGGAVPFSNANHLTVGRQSIL